MLVRICILIALVLATAQRAGAWGCEGHQIVAAVALRHLSPAARRATADLLHRERRDAAVQRSCVPLADPFVDAASWADDIKQLRPETAAWHFLDVPLTAARADLDRWCERNGCVTRAIASQSAILRDSARAPQARAEALEFLIHLIGDAHQPLHCATNGDRGATCFPVTYFGREPLPNPDRPDSGDYLPNLHAVWDNDLVRRVSRRASAAAVAERLDHRFAAEIPAWQDAPVDVDAWVWEAHLIALRLGYGALPRPVQARAPGRAVYQCTDDGVAARLRRVGERLGSRYADGAAAAVETQLAKAGIRLALLLNQIWP